MSNRKFGVTSTTSGIGGIVVNSISISHNTDIAEARDQAGRIIDIVSYSLDDQISINGLYQSDLIQPGSTISVNNIEYGVTATSLVEDNTAFQTASLRAIRNSQYVAPTPPTPPQPPVQGNPLTFKSTNVGASVQLVRYGTPDYIQLDYRINNGSWNSYNIEDTINLNEGDTVSFSGANDHFSKNQPNRYGFLFVGDVEASGNIQSLLNFSDNAPSCCFIDLFNNCTNLLTTPDLPATTLNRSCYYQMFQGCSSLVTPPIFLASTLAIDCCYAMFSGCTSLLSSPQLPATQLINYCYMNMFRDCTSLSTVPRNMLPAINLAPYCYCAMFAGCTSIKKLPYDLLYAGESLREGCYSGMFAGCTALTASPQLIAETLVERCYSGMFKGCSKLQIIYAEFRDWKQNLYGENLPTWQWVDGVAESGDFHKYFFLPDRFGTSFIPSRWTVY